VYKKNRTQPQLSSALGNSNGQLLSESRVERAAAERRLRWSDSSSYSAGLRRKEKPLRNQLQIMGKL